MSQVLHHAPYGRSSTNTNLFFIYEMDRIPGTMLVFDIVLVSIDLRNATPSLVGCVSDSLCYEDLHIIASGGVAG